VGAHVFVVKPAKKIDYTTKTRAPSKVFAAYADLQGGFPPYPAWMTGAISLLYCESGTKHWPSRRPSFQPRSVGQIAHQLGNFEPPL
jgi:hypothetical protein